MKPNIIRFEAPGLTPWLAKPTAGPRNLIHGLVIEGRRSLGLVEVGLGCLDMIATWHRLGLSAPRLDRKTAPSPLRQQLTSAGYRAEDVTDIFLSHLHPGHSGGLHDYPRARVHGLPETLGTDPSRIARLLPEPSQWVSPVAPPESFHGLASYPVTFDDFTLRLIALPGPFAGHAGWLVPLGDRWLLHMGGLIECPEELSADGPSPRQAARVLSDHQPFSRLESLQKVRRLLKREGSRVTALASFVSPALLGSSLPLLAPAKAADG